MPFKIIRNDITKMTDDAIVNAANTALRMGGGVCGAIFVAAGAEDLSAECGRIGRCEVGQAVITSAYSLPAKHIIHTVGPIWKGGSFGEAEQLHNCYINSIKEPISTANCFPKFAAVKVIVPAKQPPSPSPLPSN